MSELIILFTSGVMGKLGSPKMGDLGSPIQWKNGDPGPYFHTILGTPQVPIFMVNLGPSHENGDPSARHF